MPPALQLVLRIAFPCVDKRRKVVFQLRIGRKDRENLLERLAQELDGMGKGAVTTSVVDFQVPDNRREQDDGRIGEEITLFIDPRLIEVQKRDVGAFIGVRNVVHEAGVDGIATVRLAGIVEVDDAELRFDSVFIQMMQQMVIGDAGKVVELIVVESIEKPFSMCCLI